jgi:site-specific recombinase XerC
VEEFLDAQYGAQAPRTYNKNLSIVRDFFKWAILRGELHGDPTLAIERARARGVHRETFADDTLRAILAENHDLRDRVALRLLLDYGLRKGALKAVQYKHFDHNRRRLTIFTKGGKVRTLPIPHQPFWHDLERLILDVEAKPSDYLMARQKTIPRAGVRRFPDKPMSDHGLHRWWYGCLERAGIVAAGS